MKSVTISNTDTDLIHEIDLLKSSVIDLIKDGVLIAKDDGEIIIWNSALAAITGLSKDEAIGKKVWEIQYKMLPVHQRHEGLTDKLKALYYNLLSKEGNKYEPTLQHLINKKGENITVEDYPKGFRVDGKTFFMSTIIDVTEREKTRSRLNQSEVKYRKLIKNASFGVILTRVSDSVILDVNPSFTLLTSYMFHECVGKNVDELQIWKDPTEKETLMNKLLAEGSFSSAKSSLLTKAGKELVCELSGELLLIDDELLFLCLFRDISEEVYNTARHREMEERYRLIAENTIDVIWVIDIETLSYKYISPSVYRMLGYTSDEVRAVPLFSNLTEESRQVVHATLQEVLQKVNKGENTLNMTRHMHVDMVHKNGQLLNIDIQASFFTNSQGKIEILGVSRDMTEQIQIEKEIKESRHRFEQLVNNVPVGVYTIHSTPDQNIKFVYASPHFFELTGVSEEQLLKDAMSAFSKIHPDNFESFLQLNYEVNEKVIPFYWEGQVEVRGSYRWISIGSMPERIEGSKDLLWHGILTDITERKTAEERIRQSNAELQNLNKEKDKLFSIVAHDLKTPINGFMALTKMLTEDLEDLSLDEISRISRTLNHSAGNLFRMLENLLQWSRIQLKKVYVNNEVVNLYPLTEDIVSFYRINAEEKKINIVNKIEEGIEVVTDPNLLQIIIRNVVSNALKFTAQKGTITLSSADLGQNGIEIIIEDNGIGMDAVLLGKMYLQDQQKIQPGTNGESGTGLGLMICKEIAEKLNAAFKIESVSGRGTQVSITLPAFRHATASREAM